MASKLFIFFVVYTIGSTVDTFSTCCHDEWLPYQGSCYQFYDEEKLDWGEAIQFCRLKQSELAIIETENESKFLKYFARKLIKPADKWKRNITSFWLGASDADIDGIWKWFSTDEELIYTEWDYGLLNNSPDNHEDCLSLNGIYDFNWHAVVCKERTGYPLCERKGTTDENAVGMQVIG